MELYCVKNEVGGSSKVELTATNVFATNVFILICSSVVDDYSLKVSN